MSPSVFELAICPASQSLNVTCLDQSASASDGSVHRCQVPYRVPLLRILENSDSYRSVSLVIKH